MDMSSRIKELRLAAGLTQEELAKRLNMQKTAIAKYENGSVTNMKRSVISKMADIFKVAPSYLLALDDQEDSRFALLPIHESVSAGFGAYVGNTDGFVPVPAEMNANGTAVAIKVKGDSMEPSICDGDVIIAKKEAIPKDGDTIICMVGDEGFCKRFYRDGNRVTLISNNSNYPPKIISADDISVVAVVVMLMRTFN